MKIIVINGPNLNMLGVREPEIYGKQTYADLLEYIEGSAAELGVEVKCFQTNHEGAIVDEIQMARGVYDGIVINPAAYTHTSIAIYDALKSAGLPAVEVHISDVAKREAFRQHSYTAAACVAVVCGKGFAGYREAMKTLCERR